MAGHMDEVVNLIERARIGAAKHCYLLSAALVPEPVAQMLHMYNTTFRPNGRGVSLPEMQARIEHGTVMLFGIPCMPIPNLADVYVVIDGRAVTAESFVYHCDEMHKMARLAEDTLPPRIIYSPEHEHGEDTRRLCEGTSQEDS